METEFKSKWNIWYHHEKDNWKLEGFKKIYEIKTVKNFWQLYNNWNKLGGITNKHFFIMKENVNPIWEDPTNLKGGCWSFKILEYQCEELWIDLSTLLVTDELTKDYDIVGLSICQKKKWIFSYKNME